MAKYRYILTGVTMLTFISCSNDRSKIDLVNAGYGSDNLFIYEVSQIDANHKVKIDTLGLFCSNVLMPESDSEKLMEWQFLTCAKSGDYTINTDRYNNLSTGILNNDSILFIHPPRFGPFRILQFCPYPYIEKNETSWTWNFPIGAVWSIDSLYNPSDVDTFHIVYTMMNKTLVNSPYGNLSCYKINAVSKSKYGQAHSEFYYNNQYGFINLNMTSTNKISFRFKLLEKRKGLESMKFYSSFYTICNENKLKQIGLNISK